MRIYLYPFNENGIRLLYCYEWKSHRENVPDIPFFSKYSEKMD